MRISPASRFLFLAIILLVPTSLAAQAQVQGDPHPAETARVNALNKSGNQKMRDGDLDGAIADFTEAIKVDEVFPDYVRGGPYLNRGVALQKKGDFDAALADFNRAIKLAPNNVYAYHNRAGLHEKRKEIDEALADYSKAIKLNSKFPFAYRGRGLLLLGQGKDTEAAADFAKYLELNPEGKDALEKQIEAIKQKRVAKP